MQDPFCQVAVITGAGQGIGLAVAKKFLKEGLKVVFIDISEQLLNKAKKSYVFKEVDYSKAFFLQMDISDNKAIKNGINTILNQWGRIDILVNNASVRKETPIEDITKEEWENVISVNLGGTFFLSQAVLRAMKEQKKGKIINISSFGGQYGPLTSGVHYSASKAGQLALTKVFARSAADYGITVNAVAPAAIETPEMNNIDPGKLNKMKDGIPLKRFGTSEEVSDMVFYLASDSANYITGATIDINGGMLMR